MHVDFAHSFLKRLDKIPEKISERFEERLDFFLKNPSTPELNDHSLRGAYFGSRSINVTGDWRAIYKKTGEDEIRFVDIGTHSKLYKK